MKRRSLIAIGLTIVTAIILVTRALIFLHPTVGDEGTILHVLFQNVDKIAPGTRVTFAGKPVGEVKRVELLPEVFHRTDSLRKIFPYQVTIAIDSSVKLYKSDKISVKTAGLMGERFIAITPQPPAEGKPLIPVQSHDILRATETGSVEETFNDISNVAQKANKTMETIIQLIQKNEQPIHQATTSIQQASSQLDKLLQTLNHGHFGENISKFFHKFTAIADQAAETNLMKNLGDTASNLKTLSSRLEQSQSIDICIDTIIEGFVAFNQLCQSMEKTSQSLQTTAHQISQISESIRPAIDATGSGRSTLGKLMKDPLFYNTLLKTATKTDQLVEDIDTYGLLFHLDRNWQRKRYEREQQAAQSLPQKTKKSLDDALQAIETLQAIIQDLKKSSSPHEHETVYNEFSHGLKQVQNEMDQLNQLFYEQKDPPHEQKGTAS